MSSAKNKNSPILYLGLGLVLLVVLVTIFRPDEPTSETVLSEKTEQSTENETEDSLYPYKEIEVSQLQRKLIENPDAIIVVDTRFPKQYHKEHIIKSINLPAKTVLSENIAPAYDKEEVVLVTADLNAQTIGRMVEIFEKSNRNVSVLSGGFEMWKSEFAPTISFGDPDSPVDRAKITPISPEELEELLEKKEKENLRLAVIDVRSEGDYKKGRIPSAINIPLSELEWRTDDIPRAVRVVVYGQTDLDSFRGGVRLYDLGYSVRTLNVGFEDWAAAGLPVQKEQQR